MEKIPGFKDYAVTRSGEVYSIRRDRFLTPKLDKYGYLTYGLRMNGKSYYRTAHRLVALTYIPNPDDLPCVNHKNEIKTDNRVENLEWCTVKYNDNYGNRNEKMARSKEKKPVAHILENGTEIRYRGVKDASRKTGHAHSHIARLCREHKDNWRYI